MPSKEDFRAAWIPSLAAFLAVVTGVSLYQRGAAPETVPASAQRTTGSSELTSAAQRQWSGGPGPRLLADFLGINPVDPEVVQAAWDARERLASIVTINEPARKEALDAIEAVLRWFEQAPTGGERQRVASILAALEHYRESHSGSQKELGADLHKVTRYLGRPLDDNSEPAEVTYLWNAAQEHGISRVSFLVVTIPDYVDSNSDWTADENLEALQRASGALGYEFDRFFLPDWKPAGDASPSDPNRRLHETEPGVLLFRHVQDPTIPRVNILLVFLVTETPTGGIQQEAFRRAARYVCEWSQAAHVRGIDGQGANGTLLVLGPTFSGSSPSLRFALKAFLGDSSAPPLQGVRIVSGSATNRDNRNLLTFDTSGIPTTFSATVHTDDDLFASLSQYLCTLNPEWGQGHHVALLSESNTAYGSSYAHFTFQKPSRESEQTAESKAVCGLAFRPEVQMSFPLHISRLRAVAVGARNVPGLPLGQLHPSVAIAMGQRLTARDHIPSLTPEMTSAVVELTLSNILDTIRRKGITALGIFTTDKRDFLFLSREIARSLPNVLVFTTEGDLLFVHPDFGSFVRGTIVASTYPLFGSTQQFPTMGTQGIYNAALSLLDPDHTLPLLDYPIRPKNCSKPTVCLPQVWISVVGRDALWPIITIEVPKDASSASYMLRVALKAGQSSDSARVVKVPPAAVALLALVTLIAIGHGFAYSLSFVKLRRRLDHLQAKLQGLSENEVRIRRRFDKTPKTATDPLDEPVETEHRRFLLICFTVLGLVASWLWYLLIVWRNGGSPSPFVWWFTLLIVFVVVVLGGFWATMADRASLVRGLGGGQGPQRRFQKILIALLGQRHFVLATLTALLMAVPAVCAACALCKVREVVEASSPYYARLLLARTVSVGNWVSQATPVLLMAAALYLWAFWNARQLSMRGDLYEPQGGLFGWLCGGSAMVRADARGRSYERTSREALHSELGALLASPWRRTRPVLLAAAVTVVVLYALLTWGGGYAIDGFRYSQFAWWGTLLMVFLLAHSVSQTVHLALLLSRMLNGIGSHPIVPAFQRIANGATFDWHLWPRQSRARQLLPLLGKAQSLRLRLDGQPRAGLACGTEYEALRNDLDPTGLESAARALQSEPDVPFLHSDAWPTLVAVGQKALQILELRFWNRPRRAATKSWFETAEDLLALLASFIIRDALSRIVTGLTVALTMAFLILGSHMFYAFQGRHLFVWLDLILMGVLVIIGAVILVHFERDKVLSWSWATTPGHVNWTGGFAPRLALLVLVTLLTILAAGFPELGGSLAGWLEPLKKAIP